ncbi:uncharacterized protein HKW66_Vig0032920 [Vigna angularis]|nr:uncharacterized protein HKW66_Vig0032920 [Vigna angularis]
MVENSGQYARSGGKKEKSYSYMDNGSLTKGSKEVARESLIAISNSLPEKTLDSNSVSESKKSDGVAMPSRDKDDKFRSELISISYAESPDLKI